MTDMPEEFGVRWRVGDVTSVEVYPSEGAARTLVNLINPTGHAFVEVVSRAITDWQPVDVTPAATWLPMVDAPHDGTAIEGYYAADELVPIRWAEERVCMLAGTAPGAGTFGPGWEDVANGLYMDTPTAWRPLAAADQKAGRRG